MSLRGAARLFLLGALFSACARPRPLDDGYGTTSGCTLCHGGVDNATGAPPNDTFGGNATTLIGVGAHTAHLTRGPVAGPIACGECHVVPDPGNLGAHIDGAAEVTFGALATTGGVVPTFDPATGTCANTYCHGATLPGGTDTSPTWTRVGEGEAACGTCHGVPPPAPHPEVSAGVTGCIACHPGSVDAQGNIVAGGTHLDGHVDGGTHAAGWATPGSDAFHGATAATDLSTCKGCHGADLAGAGSAPSCESCHGGWRSSCTFCHGDAASGQAAPPRAVDGATATTDPGVGAHAAHLGGGPLAVGVPCASCHVVPTDALSPGHMDAAGALVTFSGLARDDGAQPTFDAAATTCQNTYCHGSTLGGGSHPTPTWTKVGAGEADCGDCHGIPPPSPHTARTDCEACHPGYTSTSVAAATHVDGKIDVVGLSCTSCHGDDTRAKTTLNPLLPAAPPMGVHGETLATQRPVGAHQAHLVGDTVSNGVACGECHVVPSSVLHANGQTDVMFGALATSGSAPASWSSSAGTCTGAYCHGGTLSGGTVPTVSWTSTSLSCDGCHGLPPSTGQHAFHASRSKDCFECHGAGYVTSGSQTVNRGTHVDSTVEVGPPSVSGSSITAYDPGTGNCTPTCHATRTW